MKILSILALNVICFLTTYGQSVQTILYENWKNDNWVNSIKDTFTYNGSNHLTYALDLAWDTLSSSWENNIQDYYTYNPNGTTQQVISYQWDNDNQSWYNSQQVTYTYDSGNRPLTITFQNSGVNSVKETNTYDGNGYLINRLEQTWNTSSNSWVDYQQRNYINDGNGRLQQEIVQYGGAPWFNAVRVNYSYTGSNKMDSVTIETWTNLSWVNSSKQLFIYDGDDYLINMLEQNWDNNLGSWKNTRQFNYTNNSNGTVHQYIWQRWDTPTSSWVNYQRATYTYILSSDILELNSLKFSIYPNPTKDRITISLIGSSDTKISIIDLQGKVVFMTNFFGDKSVIDVSALPANLYFMTLQRDNVIQVTKFLKD